MKEVIDKELKFKDHLDKDVWIEEAERWRLPYWDWAVKYPDSEMPKLFTTEKITICNPKGSNDLYINMDNPLARYQLQDKFGHPQLMGTLEWPYTIEDDADSKPKLPVISISVLCLQY